MIISADKWKDRGLWKPFSHLFTNDTCLWPHFISAHVGPCPRWSTHLYHFEPFCFYLATNVTRTWELLVSAALCFPKSLKNKIYDRVISSPILICYFPAGQLIHCIFFSMSFICSEFRSLYTSACFYECPCPKSKRPVTLIWREFSTCLMAAYFIVFLLVSYLAFWVQRSAGPRGVFWLRHLSVHVKRNAHVRTCGHTQEAP